MNSAQWIHLLLNLSVALLALGTLPTLARLAKGPSLADRMVASSQLGTLLVAALGAGALIDGAALFVDLALVAALTGFLSTLAFGLYLGRASEDQAQREALGQQQDPTQGPEEDL
ncbi:MAG: monovalent cation/H+ antiporter complex subunit F [bacterium]|nr:monovalent cation/H+ antiporter complex subunit F [bacterium]